MTRPLRLVALLGATALALVACGGGAGTEDDARPTVVVTHSILGNVVEEVAGEQVEVLTIMGPGADPHDFSPSARDVDAMRSAEVLVVNGGGFEAGLTDVIDAARADGVATFEALAATRPLPAAGHDDDHGAEDDHEDGEGLDPHFFSDPSRMAEVVDELVDQLVLEVEDIDEAALKASAGRYRNDLLALDEEIEDLLDDIGEDDRVLVTNHEVFAYLADRYGFEVAGTVLPGASTLDSASAADLDELADVIAEIGVPAIFVEQSSSRELADTVAAEAGSVEVVTLFSESLGESGSGGATYLEMTRTNAERIAAALGPNGP